MRRSKLLAALGATLCLTASTAAAQVVVPLEALEFTADTDPRLDRGRWLAGVLGPTVIPRVVVDGHDAFLGTPQIRSGINAGSLPSTLIAVDAAEVGGPLTGTLYLPDPDGRRFVAHPFRAPAAAQRVDEEAWRGAVAKRALALSGGGLPGTPWFRRQARAHGGETFTESSWGGSRGFVGGNTYAMFTGGRALAENLRLDDVFALDGEGEPTVDIADIPGVTVDEMSFDGLLAIEEPELDPLAAMIPIDQHAVFFPSFEALVRVADDLEDEARPLVHAFDGRGESARVRERYERQLLLSLDGVARTMGGFVVDSIAMTGSDPYLRTGSDVAILFRCGTAEGPLAIRTWLETAASRREVDVERVEVAGVEVMHWGTEARTTDAWFAHVGATAIVANSEHQLARVLRVHAGEEGAPEPLLDAPEYTWFRQRYPLGAEGEDAFVVLTDAAIRRWSGPKWRIGAARRLRAIAVLADADAWRIAVGRNAEAGDAPPKESTLQGGGAIDLTGAWAREATYNTRMFTTPIGELEIPRVTADESHAYAAWRRAFERSWGGAFDPVAASIDVRDDGIAIDTTIVPLIGRTSYQWLLDLAGEARIARGAPGPHDGALVFWQVALDGRGEIADAYRYLVEATGAPPLEEWCGGTMTFWVDEDPEYVERIRETVDTDEFVDEMLPGFPAVLEIAVTRPEVAVEVLEEVIGLIEENSSVIKIEIDRRSHEGLPYIALIPDEEDYYLSAFPTLYAGVTPEGMLLSISESSTKRAITRTLAGRPLTHWEGRSTGLRIGGDLRNAIGVQFVGEASSDRLRARSWANLPILNEWRRLGFEDAVAAHERVWGTELICPGGGEYVWDEEHRTMSSTVFGHPAAPLEGTTLPPGLLDVEAIDFALDFDSYRTKPRAQPEPGDGPPVREAIWGMRARVVVER